MTDCGEYTDADFAEIWDELSRAERYADKMEAGLDALNGKLDAMIEARNHDFEEAAKHRPDTSVATAVTALLHSLALIRNPGTLIAVPPPMSDDRLGLEPAHRIILFGGLAGIYGLFHGVTKGAKLASLRYLAENAHRLPRTKGTWYFFHKRKNYVLLKDGINAGVLQALKFGGLTATFFACEAGIDRARNRVSALSTMGAAQIVGLSVAFYQRLGSRQIWRILGQFSVFGLVVGLVQDAVRGLSAASRQDRAKRIQQQKAD